VNRYEVTLSNGFICTVLAPDAGIAKRVAHETLALHLEHDSHVKLQAYLLPIDA
jgi:hypothetical protein